MGGWFVVHLEGMMVARDIVDGEVRLYGSFLPMWSEFWWDQAKGLDLLLYSIEVVNVETFTCQGTPGVIRPMSCGFTIEAWSDMSALGAREAIFATSGTCHHCVFFLPVVLEAYRAS